ncbi:MAG: NADH-dependent [FeFe] hydrogenase, group A6 [Spirochaetia bacterium]|nr:NADH-dependent [FeFe] hydrogenase, group A6 [Spirochaetia bacterium]
MSTVNIQINGKPITVEKGTHILGAARQAGVKIPSLCAHPDLDAWAACGICVVKVANSRGVSPKLVRACATECVEGENYITHDPELHKIRKTIIEMILADHPQNCLTCGRNGSCELQTLAAEFGIREIPYARNVKNMPKDDSTGAIVLDPSKCVQCGRCAQVCQQLQNVWALEFIGRGEKTRIAGAGDIVLNETPCIKCGQCSAHCPVGAIYELDETGKLLAAIQNPDLTVVAQIAPAVRVAIGEEFGLEPGEITTGKIYAALRAIGVDTVFDTNFAADLTIMEEGTEFVHRFTEKKNLPLITSCCPAWVEYMEKYACDMIPNFSTAKSPQQMQGAITKTYYAQTAKLDPAKIFSVSIMPCTAKKQEIKRSEDMFSSGYQDNDLVLTTRELARLFKQFGIDFKNIEPQKADSPIGQYTGAGTIFGVTGGVMEAALRTAYSLVTGDELPNDAVDFTAVRGMDGIKTATVDVKGTPVRVAVAHGLKNVQTLLQEVREARENGKEVPYHFIEVMACKGGCIAGGGQPYGTEDEIRAKRIDGLYADDKKSEFRKSHQNPDIKKIYADFLEKPSSHKAHKLLHTHYVPRPTYKK